MNIKNFENLWSAHQPEGRGQADFWDRRADSYAAHGAGGEAEEQRRLMIGALAALAGRLGEMSQDGRVREKVEAKLVMMFWRI